MKEYRYVSCKFAFYVFSYCRCFIMEDRGYLVAHPTLIDPKGHAPAEQQHITHKVKDFIQIYLLIKMCCCYFFHMQSSQFVF